MLKQAIELLQEIMEEEPLLEDHITDKVHDFLMKAYNYKPSVYLEIRGGVLNNVYATEEINAELFDWDNYESGDTDKDPDEWERMIEEGLNSKQLIEIPI